jgi:transcriptional regulator with XRE-family HTH domain
MAEITTPLRKLRHARGFSLAYVARRVGTFTGNLSRIECGKQEASKAISASLAAFFAPELTEMHVLYPERYPDFEPVYTGLSEKSAIKQQN